ncbi:HlyD family efflux transporter periplasmic adaptor subunit [Shewanella sp. Isolate11]|uniref:HlyD family secretion protein n=1 Tax=Shewanella sp. Isolate11 TaxID=2908530 RepID=UPI001EFEC116|nr:HlyD family efflux transporter periplasmic adaptor subunit [Shewanella sp. Isolate11]MCG9696449.1 HlyD family secretion protein [Shewanella sp. Isolate11]
MQPSRCSLIEALILGSCLCLTLPAFASETEPASLLLTGKISSVESQTFTVPKAGDAWRYQIQWMLPEGTLAQPGQSVVIFDKSQLTNQIEQLEASLLRVTAQEQSTSLELNGAVLQAKFNVKQNQLEVEKAQLDADVPVEFIAAKEYAENQFALMQAKSELSKAKQTLTEALDKQAASLKQLAIDKQKAQLELTQALQGIEQLQLTAKLAGPVLYGRDHWSDEKYGVGDTVQIGRQIATIPALNQLEVVAWVNEVDVDRLKLKQAVSLRLDAQSNISFSGVVSSIGKQAMTQVAWGRSKWFKVGIDFDRDSSQINLVPGMSVLVATKELSDE